MAASKPVQQVVNGGAPRLTWVFEDGTHDPFYAVYVDGKLVATNPRSDLNHVLDALGVPQETVYVPRGFSGDFPQLLTALKTYTK